jgi:hypothetical protein
MKISFDDVQMFLGNVYSDISGKNEKILPVEECVCQEVDSFFLQSLVQTRYFGTVDAVWVYGCADKT